MTHMSDRSPILQIGDVLFSPEIITEFFCCNIDECHGACCIEGDAGAPLTEDESQELNAHIGDIRSLMMPVAAAITADGGATCRDCEGETVTRTVCGRDCVFATHSGGRCLCVIEQALSAGTTTLRRPISCELYPIREHQLPNGLTALNYHRWDICDSARRNGARQHMPVYRFVKAALVRRFGSQWFSDLDALADIILKGTND